MKFHQNYQLKNLTTFKIGGPAKYFTQLSNEKELTRAIEFSEEKRLPVFVLGGGSNIVVSDKGFPGLVIHNKIKGFYAKKNKSTVTVSIGAGELWDEVVRQCVEKNWAGIECLSGIPGTAGAAPVQNIGAYGQEISSVIRHVKVFDRKTKTIQELLNSDCGFRYRKSVFNSTARDRYIVTGITIGLKPNGAPTIIYHDLKERFSGQECVTLTNVRNAIIETRAKKGMLILPRQENYKSAGSFFKHPVVSRKTFERIRKTAEKDGKTNQWYWELPSGEIKILATYLIQEAGFFPGYRKGNVGISPRHALSLISYKRGTAKDIIALAKEIRKSVKRRFNVTLLPEPEFVGFPKHPLK